jgi:hypothetical protein
MRKRDAHLSQASRVLELFVCSLPELFARAVCHIAFRRCLPELFADFASDG